MAGTINLIFAGYLLFDIYIKNNKLRNKKLKNRKVSFREESI